MRVASGLELHLRGCALAFSTRKSFFNSTVTRLPVSVLKKEKNNCSGDGRGRRRGGHKEAVAVVHDGELEACQVEGEVDDGRARGQVVHS